MQNDGLHDLHSPPHKIIIVKSRRITCAGHVARMQMKRKKKESKRPLGRARYRWEDNIVP
jgi:hypothetical protein